LFGDIYTPGLVLRPSFVFENVCVNQNDIPVRNKELLQ